MRTWAVASAVVMALCAQPGGSVAAPSMPVPEGTAGALQGSAGVTAETGGETPAWRFVSHAFEPVELWDTAAGTSRLLVLEVVSEQRRQFLQEVPEGSLTLAAYPLELGGAGAELWRTTLPAQAGHLMDLGLFDPFYEVVFAGHPYAGESRGLVSLHSGALLLDYTRPPATLRVEGDDVPALQWLAGLHAPGTVRDAALFGSGLPDAVILTLATPERRTDRVRLVLEDPALLATAASAELTFGFASAAGEAPSTRLRLLAGEGQPRLVVQFARQVGAVIPLGPNGLALSQAVANGLRLERLEVE